MKLNWIDTTGGPHLLLPTEELGSWCGVEGWKEGAAGDTSDYSRACNVREWIGKIPCGQRYALVFSGDVGQVAWLPKPEINGGMFLQWIGANSDEQVVEFAKSSQALACLSDSESPVVSFKTGPSGRLRLMDSTDNGLEGFFPFDEIQVSAGTYNAKAGYFSSKKLMIVVRELARVS